jgi:hypothetical protein
MDLESHGSMGLEWNAEASRIEYQGVGIVDQARGSTIPRDGIRTDSNSIAFVRDPSRIIVRIVEVVPLTPR